MSPYPLGVLKRAANTAGDMMKPSVAFVLTMSLLSSSAAADVVLKFQNVYDSATTRAAATQPASALPSTRRASVQPWVIRFVAVPGHPYGEQVELAGYNIYCSGTITAVGPSKYRVSIDFDMRRNDFPNGRASVHTTAELSSGKPCSLFGTIIGGASQMIEVTATQEPQR